MKKPNTSIVGNASGYTLIEVTAVMAVLLGLIAVMFIGIAAWVEGPNRAQCVLNVRNVQNAVRSYANMYEYKVGDSFDSTLIMGGADKMIPVSPACKTSGASYTYETTVPDVGVPFAVCSESKHAPKSTSGW